MAGAAQRRLEAVTDRVWLTLILVVAGALRLYEIDLPDIWVDEANLILTSRQPLPVLFEKLRLDSSPPLYYLAVHLWSGAFGDGAVALRMLSWLTGMALVAATYWVGRDLLSARAGLWGAFYIALSPGQSFFSQQVRMYGLLALLGLLCTASLVRFLRDGRRGDFALWVGTAVVSLYNHNFAIHLLAAHIVLIAISGQLLRRIGFWVLATAIVVVLYAPWVPTLLVQLENRDHYAWFLPYWEYWGIRGVAEKSIRSFSPAGEFFSYAGIGSFKLWRGVPTWTACALAALGAAVCFRRARESNVAQSLWPLILLLSPAATALFLSSITTPHLVPGRVDQMMLPAYALLIGLGITWLRPGWLRVVLGAAILSVGLWSKFTFYDIYTHDEIPGSDRVLAARIAKMWQPDDVIITTSLSRAPLAYYFGRAGVAARFVSYPQATAAHLGSQNDNGLLEDQPALMREAAATLAEARSMAGGNGRVFLVWVHGLVNYPLRREALLSYGFRELAEIGRFRQFGTGLQMEARLYAPQSEPARPR